MAAALCLAVSGPAALAGEAAAPSAPQTPSAAPSAPVAPDASKSESDETFTLSQAQTLIFNRPHLAAISQPTVLRYSFERKGQLSDDFKDEVKVKIDRIQPDGAKDVSFDVFTGERNKYYPPVEHFRGNPLVMIMLQRDVYDMKRLWNGNANYYRNKIRYAFHDSAEVSDVTVEGPNGPIKGQKVVVRPFAKEPASRPEQAIAHDKRYEFVVSPDVPGEIYSVTMVTPARDQPKEGGSNVLEEKLVFQGSEPAGQPPMNN